MVERFLKIFMDDFFIYRIIRSMSSPS